MKLYNLDHSPYATRVRMQIIKKGLDIDIEPPPVPLRSDEYNARFPLGKIPVLELDDGSQLPDSWVIMEYLEDRFPEPSLRPDGPRERAHMQLLARYADTYLGPGALFPLFKLVQSPGGGDDAADALSALDVELTKLERLLEMLQETGQRSLHIGDIALAPAMDYVLLLCPLFGREQALAQFPRVAAWWDRVIADPAVAEGSGQMRTAVKAFFGG